MHPALRCSRAPMQHRPLDWLDLLATKRGLTYCPRPPPPPPARCAYMPRDDPTTLNRRRRTPSVHGGRRSTGYTTNNNPIATTPDPLVRPWIQTDKRSSHKNMRQRSRMRISAGVYWLGAAGNNVVRSHCRMTCRATYVPPAVSLCRIYILMPSIHLPCVHAIYKSSYRRQPLVL